MTESATGPLLQVEDLAVEFRTPYGVVRAVDGLSYTVEAGRTLAIVGESGSGKSVSSLAVMGLLPTPPARIAGGRALLHGRDLLTLPAKEHRAVCGDHVAMVFQDALAALNPVHTVGWQLTEALVARHRIPRRDARKRAVELLDLVKMPHAQQRVKDYPHQFSGGMRQRAMIAMALAMDPEVLIADEPTTALDVTVQAQIMRLLAEIQAERRMGLVLITHDLGVVADVADEVVVMYAGRAVEQADVFSAYGSPAHPYTKALLASIPRLDQKGGTLDVIPGRPPEQGSFPDGCPFHPRCGYAQDVCRSNPRPEPVEVAPGRYARCHFAADVMADREPVALTKEVR